MAIEATPNVGTKLLFENERIRVWDLALQPGEYLEKHIHREEFLFIVVEGGSLRHIDPENSANDRAVEFENDLVVHHQPDKNSAEGGTIHHRLVNVGDKPYRNYVIEIKSEKE